LEDESEIRVIATCNNGKEVLKILPKSNVDVLMLDLDMPIMNGLQCAEVAKQNYPNLKIAILTMHREKALIERFIEFGVNGYFLKSIQKDELVQAIKSISSGTDYFPSDVTKALIQKQSFAPDVTQSQLLNDLTKREIEIIQLVAQGFTNNEIGKELDLSLL